MSDTPKFEVIDRRKMKAEEEQVSQHAGESAPEPAAETPSAPAESGGGPRLVVNESRQRSRRGRDGARARRWQRRSRSCRRRRPPQESQEQKTAYDASAQRLEDLIRAQNPAAGAQPPVGFEHLVQQFYVSAMIQMGAGTQEGQRPRVDILGARTTIDLLGVLAEKTKGNLTEAEDRTLQTVLFEVRMAFLELTSMINMQAMQPPAAAAGEEVKRREIREQGPRGPRLRALLAARAMEGTTHISGNGNLDGGSHAGVRVRGVHFGRSARPAAAAFGAGALARSRTAAWSGWW